MNKNRHGSVKIYLGFYSYRMYRIYRENIDPQKWDRIRNAFTHLTLVSSSRINDEMETSTENTKSVFIVSADPGRNELFC